MLEVGVRGDEGVRGWASRSRCARCRGWASEWYVREETLRAANLAIIDYHQRLPLTTVFGAGTLSSSDGQRFPVRGKSTSAREMVIHGGRVLSTYTHVTDQHATYGTKIIVATKREAHYVLDEILGNATDLPSTEHATDTHGVTLVNFGLFDLLGMQLSPRIRDLGKITLYRPGPRRETEARFPHAGPLMTRRANLELIAEHWDDLLRLAGSLKFGHATASLLVGKLSASGRQNTLATALEEYGALRRIVYAVRYLSDPDYRRKISRQLNKGESLHALRRDLLYAHEGTIRARQLEDQTEQAWCLTLATNAVIAWTTEYYGLAVEQMRRAGRRIEDEVLAHISPAHSENINFFGAIEVDIDAELAQLGPTGYRPLRVRDTLFRLSATLLRIAQRAVAEAAHRCRPAGQISAVLDPCEPLRPVRAGHEFPPRSRRCSGHAARPPHRARHAGSRTGGGGFHPARSSLTLDFWGMRRSRRSFFTGGCRPVHGRDRRRRCGREPWRCRRAGSGRRHRR
ncbi:transposase [Nocardia vinacea]|nr:transposase [Nocardia vinacea]